MKRTLKALVSVLTSIIFVGAVFYSFCHLGDDKESSFYNSIYKEDNDFEVVEESDPDAED